MASPPSNRLVARLLSGRDRLGRVEKDAMREHILDATASPARAPRRVAAMLVAGALAAAGVVLFLQRAPRQGEAPEFASRGAVGPIAALRATCGHGDQPCRRGDQLVFDLAGARGYRYLAAFAQRDDGTVVWYFPADDGGVSVDLGEHVKRGALDRSAVIDAQHTPGRYRLYAIFSTGPLTRAAIRERFAPERADLGPNTAVVARELVVQ